MSGSSMKDAHVDSKDNVEKAEKGTCDDEKMLG